MLQCPLFQTRTIYWFLGWGNSSTRGEGFCRETLGTAPQHTMQAFKGRENPYQRFGRCRPQAWVTESCFWSPQSGGVPSVPLSLAPHAGIPKLSASQHGAAQARGPISYENGLGAAFRGPKMFCSQL